MNTRLPKLTVIPKSKTRGYKLDDPAYIRRKALAFAINKEQKTRNITLREAAKAKKYRLNVLRIYRRYRLQKECAKITRDMKWIDKTYLKNGKTRNICN